MFRVLSVVSIMVLVACSSMNEPQRISKSELHTRIGTGLLKNNRLPQAMGELLTAVDLDPKNQVAHNNLALVYLLRKKPNLAERHLRTALKLQPKYTEAKNNLGRVFIEQGRLAEAITILNEAKTDLVYPAPEKILTNLGLAQFKSGQYLRAQNSLEQAIDLNRSDCLATNLWAKTFFKLEQYRRAAMGFDKAIDVCKIKKFAEPQYLSGVSYMKVGRREVAKTRFEELLNEYPAGKYHAKATKILANQRQESKKTH